MPSYNAPNRPKNPSGNFPAYPVAVPPLVPESPLEGYPAIPYPADLTAGDGASRAFRPNPAGSYSTNVPQPDNKGPVKTSGDQGLGVM